MSAINMTTSIIALTTIFTPAPNCTAQIYASSGYYNIGGPNPSACFPSGWDSTSQSFSPGICPTGYDEVCSAVFPGETATQTVAKCCPSGWGCSYDTAGGQNCVTRVEEAITRVVIDAIASTTSTVTFGWRENSQIYGYAVSIQYQSSDHTQTRKTTSAIQPVITATTTTSSTSATRTSIYDSTPKYNPTKKKNRTGKILGIVLGVVVFLAVAISLFLRRRDRKKKEKNLDPVEDESPPPYDLAVSNDPERSQVVDKSTVGQTSNGGANSHEIHTIPLELGENQVKK